jgi:hypothetical protein
MKKCVRMCSFRHHVKYKNAVKHYRSAVCKMKTCNWALVTGVAYNNAHNAAAQFKAQQKMRNQQTNF